MPNETPINMEKPIKALLIEDNWRMSESLVNGMRVIDPNLQFVAVVENSVQALEHLQNKTIDLVVMDYELKDSDLWGVELTRKIIRQFPNIKIIFWSANTREVDKTRAKGAGAHGYVSKEKSDTYVKDAIDRVMRGGEAWLADSISDNMLTDTEVKILEQLAKGKSNQQIAVEILKKEFRELKEKYKEEYVVRYKNVDEYMDDKHKVKITHAKDDSTYAEEYKEVTRLEARTRTVEKHLTNIREKLKIRTRGELIRVATKDYSELEDRRDISVEEINVLELLHEGKNPEEIGEILGIISRDVEKIRQRFNLGK